MEWTRLTARCEEGVRRLKLSETFVGDSPMTSSAFFVLAARVAEMAFSAEGGIERRTVHASPASRLLHSMGSRKASRAVARSLTDW